MAKKFFFLLFACAITDLQVSPALLLSPREQFLVDHAQQSIDLVENGYRVPPEILSIPDSLLRDWGPQRLDVYRGPLWQ